MPLQQTSFKIQNTNNKILSGREATIDMSNDLQPTKSGLKTGYHNTGQTSQIPGLSPGVSSVPEEARARGRRVAILESDSDYVKLAKQGGQKDLLWHEEAITAKPRSYKAPEWFCSTVPETDDPSLIKNKEKKTPGAFQLLEPPFGTDDKSAWERDDSSNGKEKLNNDPTSQMETLPISSQHEASKFKRIVFDKRPAPVNMSKLLSFGYAEDDKPKARSDVSMSPD
ncbi:uncharacterized protein C7orf57 homolog isoform X2 [Myripristis murdjan]|uniref:uncharacterized protein C7orf57 homolog isoform X2 n=1 Tax=Myripristis murdjan TaxID=586833 RepID=UPI00117608BB|nr:uncharacterized protein C7orf57 homolog isoform X2 [Myripristis murdjan]